MQRAVSRVASVTGGTVVSGSVGGTVSSRPLGSAVVDCQHAKHDELEGVMPAESFQAMLQTWAMLHGFVSLEAYGHFDWIEPDARDALFHSHIRLAATAAGLPVPAA